MNENPITEGEVWFKEMHTPDAGLSLRVREHLFSKMSDYQLIEVFDTFEYGRILTLDRLIMISERDESHYHEMLVHVPMLVHPSPRRVLVIGGGDGGTLRELVKHPSLERAVQVEIDIEVVEACKKYFFGVATAFDHPKVALVIEDALSYVKSCMDRFDVIILDSSDPVGPAVGLFQLPFYRDLHGLLEPGGVVAGQIGSPFYEEKRISGIFKNLKTLFSSVSMYTAFTPAYPSGLWGFAIATNDGLFFNQPDEVRYRTLKPSLNYYNPEVHRGSFLLPSNIQQLVRGD